MQQQGRVEAAFKVKINKWKRLNIGIQCSMMHLSYLAHTHIQRIIYIYIYTLYGSPATAQLGRVCVYDIWQLNSDSENWNTSTGPKFLFPPYQEPPNEAAVLKEFPDVFILQHELPLLPSSVWSNFMDVTWETKANMQSPLKLIFQQSFSEG